MLPYFAVPLRPDGVTIVAGEASGRLHFLRLENIEELYSNPK
jgi:hypothetical protein